MAVTERSYGNTVGRTLREAVTEAPDTKTTVWTLSAPGEDFAYLGIELLGNNGWTSEVGADVALSPEALREVARIATATADHMEGKD